MRTTIASIAVALACATCSENKPSGPIHWSKQPLETVTEVIRDQKFQIQLPKGMKPTSTGWRREWTYHQMKDGKDKAYPLKVAIGWIEPRTKMERLLGSGIDSPLVLRKEQREDGFIYSHQMEGWRDNQHFQIIAQQYTGKAAFICEIHVSPMFKGENTREYLPLAENMCLSIQPAP
jgi:hypothetical protein